MSNNFLCNFFRIAYEERSVGASLGFKIPTSYRRPSTFLSDFIHAMCIAWKKVINCLLSALCHITQGMYTYLQLMW